MAKWHHDFYFFFFQLPLNKKKINNFLPKSKISKRIYGTKLFVGFSVSFTQLKSVTFLFRVVVCCCIFNKKHKQSCQINFHNHFEFFLCLLLILLSIRHNERPLVCSSNWLQENEKLIWICIKCVALFVVHPFFYFS